ncbi:sensor histidine kinase [Sorangium sp. So ce233]|uniref:sensor histidine kinase n=1 Tax=Sorangium sp. So ce233 TaxID=3133290 RepID=UPI003F5F33AF
MERPDQPEEEIATLFRSAGQELTEAVGTRPGEVWRFAQPTAGVVRPRTLWLVWVSAPVDWPAALDTLEQTRVAAGADRALAVLWDGSLPAGYSTDLERRPATAITRRRLALELASVPELVKRGVEEYDREEGPRYYLQRRGTVNGEPVDDLAAYLVDWSQGNDARNLVLVGEGTGRTSVVREAAYRVGRSFLQNPDVIRPILRENTRLSRSIPVRSLGDWVCPWQHVSVGFVGRRRSVRALYIVESFGANRTVSGGSLNLVVKLHDATDEDVITWYRARLTPELGALLAEAFRYNSDLAMLLRALPLLRVWVGAISAAQLRPGEPNAQVVAQVISRFFGELENLGSYPGFSMFQDSIGHLPYVVEDSGDELEDAALEHFALQRASSLSLIQPDEREPLRWIGIRYNEDPGFYNTLVRDYFLARKIIREVQAGRRDILTRYQFPREHVLLFLAILSPEVAASAFEDRSHALRAEIAEQAEQEVQLVLAHHLKRSVGAIRTQMEALREHLPRELGPGASRAVHRIEQELDYLRRLADRTRRLHQVPKAELTDVSLADVLDAAASQLRSSMPQVSCAIHVEAELRVRGNRDSLEEIFACLLENAFHAAAFDRPDPRVAVILVDEGATVRVDVTDNGVGVRAEDRARIFDPRVTTKKGGDGRPMGTGMGLPIARKYAEAIGGRVDLDPDKADTTFFVRLIKARGAE